MKNKGVVISSINNAQAFFKEELTPFKGVTRPTLESILLTYVDRYRASAEAQPTVVLAKSFEVEGFVTTECPSCEGTGLYEDSGKSCHRCVGKGQQTESDQKRNYGYDLHHPHNDRPSVRRARHAKTPVDLIARMKAQFKIEPIADDAPFDEDNVTY